MSRRRKKKSYSNHYKSGTVRTPSKRIKVTVAVPSTVARWMPSRLSAPQLNQWRSVNRHLRIPLKKTRKTVLKSVIVNVPKGNRPLGAKMMVGKKGLTVFSQRNTRKHLETEQNRKRRKERKRWRRRASTGYLDSVRRDRHGILSANRSATPERLADAAMVALALEKF